MQRRSTAILAAAALLTCGDRALAQDERRLKTKLFRDAPYYEPLLAEPRPARIMLLIPAWSKEFPHSLEPGNRFAWQISLGEELPVVTLSDQAADGALNPGRWGIGLWIPISFHVIEDFKDPSNPIVDTDYRFGFMVKFQKRFEPFTLGVRFVPWNHESTHLGDEYTIFASRDPSFERINVSYENWEYGLSLEGEGLFSEGDPWKVRHGGRQPWGEDGYYSNHLLGRDESTLTPSVANFEPGVGAEYRFGEWRGRQIYFSVDLRYQTVYTYHQTPDNPEQRQWSSNWQIGRAVPEGTRGAFSFQAALFSRPMGGSMASDYPGRTVLIGYFFENQDAGTARDREQFSNDIFDSFDAHIVEACGEAEPPIDPSPRIRAAIAVMAQNAPGSNNRLKARRAVQAYLTFRGF